jgi:hypothetical protein
VVRFEARYQSNQCTLSGSVPTEMTRSLRSFMALTFARSKFVHSGCRYYALDMDDREFIERPIPREKTPHLRYTEPWQDCVKHMEPNDKVNELIRQSNELRDETEQLRQKSEELIARSEELAKKIERLKGSPK